MLGFLIRFRGLIVGAGLTILALGLLSSGRRDEGLVGRSVGVLGAPIQKVVRAVADGIGGAVDHYVFLVGESERADTLRREVAELKRELLAVEEVSLENQRLKTLLEFKESTALKLVPARVVGRSATAWYQSFVLDKGTSAGVGVDCPVVTPAGVVGRVFEAGSSVSRVLLLTDANSAVDAIVQSTRAQVLVEGRLEPTCRALYLARGDEASPGDRVVTSGLGGVFPKGLLLGQISQIQVHPGEVFHTAELVPSADFSRLEEVFVILRESADGT